MPDSTDLATVEDIPPVAPAVVPAGSPSMTSDTMAMLWREAKALAAGGMFKDVTEANHAFAKLMIGHHLGLSPAQSMAGIDIVKGNAQLRGTLLGTLVRERPGYDWKILEVENDKASIEFFRDGESEGISTWTQEDAKLAGLLKDDSNHKKYPRNMNVARAMSNGVKWFVPETMGGIPVYVEGELDNLPSPMRDGGTDDTASMSPTDMAKVELAIKTHVPDDQQERALHLLATVNRLAPNSWSAGKIEMVLAGKTPQAIALELDHLQKQIDELRPPETAAEEGTEPDADEDAPFEPTPEQATRILRIQELEDALQDNELPETQRSDAEAEIDMLQAELPTEIILGQGSLPL